MPVHSRPSHTVRAAALSSFALLAVLALATSAAAQTVGDPGRDARGSAPQDALRFNSEGLTETQSPDGGVTVDLEGRFQHYLVAHTGADGKLHVGCTQDPADGPAHAPTGVEIRE